MIDFPIVDSHVHLCDPDHLQYSWTKDAPALNRRVMPDDLARDAAPVEVDRFVFVEVDVDRPLHVAEAAWVADLAANDPRIAGMVASLPLETGVAVQEDLERLREHSLLRGIRRLIQGESDPEFCTKPDFIAGLKLLAKHDLSFDICILHHQMPAVLDMVRQCPEVRFVLDHIGKPGIKAGLMEPWRAQMTELAGFPNVECKISGVATEADHQTWTREQLKPYVAHAIDAFGIDRCMFGGDWHVATLAVRYPEWVEIVDEVLDGASSDDKRKLFRDNAARFYRLDA